MLSGAQIFDALILNGDGRPVSMTPLSLMRWQDSVQMLLSKRAYRVASYDKFVNSPSVRLQLPSVLALTRFYPRRNAPTLTRFNIFLRDNFSCQYCNARPGITALTIDHVVPRALGGQTRWNNVVACCAECNRRKGSKPLHSIDMLLKTPPETPSRLRLDAANRYFPPGFLHETWRDYLYWDSPLDP